MTTIAVKELKGRHVLYALCGFFGMMLIANGIFIYMAVSTFTGLERDAYQKGLHYNQRIEAGQAQAALGWTHKLELAPDGGVRLSISAADGSPVTGLAISGDIARPAAEHFTQPLAFAEIEGGRYLAPVQLEPGNWIVALQAAKAGAATDAVYRMRERLWLRPRQ